MDVAALSLRIDSSEVVRATKDLERFSSASDRARSAAGGTTGNTAKMAQDYARAAEKAGQFANAASRAAEAAQRSAVATNAAASAAKAATPAITANVTVLGRLASAYDFARDAVHHWVNRLTAVPAATSQAVAGINRVTKAANDNAGAIRANTGNIAAQFQDVGVTAAMGMNPLIIGLQQGTQLSAVFAQSGASMGTVLAGAFRQIASAQALMTIGLVAAVAGLIQLVDWAKLAQGALNLLADNLVAIAPYAVGAAAALALIYSPAIIGGILTLISTIGKLTVAMLSLVSIPVLIVAGLTAIVAAAIHFRDDLTKMLGFDIVQAVHDSVNWIVGAFVGGFNGIKASWGQLPGALGDIAYQAANAMLAGIDFLINRSIAGINDLIGRANQIPFVDIQKLGSVSVGRVANPYAGVAAGVGETVQASIKAAQGVDYVGKAISTVNSLAEKGAGKLREWAKALGATDGKADPSGGAAGGASAAGGATTDKWQELIANADRQQRALTQAGAQIGVYGQALGTLRREQELFNAAQDAGIKLTGSQSDELRRRAAEMAATEYANTRRQATEATTRAHADAMRQLDGERMALSLTGEALLAYQYRQQAINRELQAGVELKDIDIAKIDQQARAYGVAAAANDAQRAAIDQQKRAVADARDVTRGFFFDWIDGAREGANVFRSFTDSVLNSLNRITDKLLDRTLDGFLNNIGGGALASLFGGGSRLTTATAQGGVNQFLDSYQVAKPFAKGGVFTNSIVNTPTLFRFANGAAMGEMGEAGPEAIMPLKRGPNGSLGVQVHGGGGGPSVRLGDVHNHFNITGGPDDRTTALIQQAAQDSITYMRRELENIAGEHDRDGSVVQ